MTAKVNLILIDDNGAGSKGFRFEAELLNSSKFFVFGFGDTQDEALFSITLKLGFDDLGDMPYEVVQRCDM